MLSFNRTNGLLSFCLVFAVPLWAHDEHELFFGVEDRGGVTLNAIGHEGFRMKVQSSVDGVGWQDFGSIDPPDSIISGLASSKRMYPIFFVPCTQEFRLMPELTR